MSSTDTEANRVMLNLLVDKKFTAKINGCFGMSALLRWGEEETTVIPYEDNSKGFQTVNKIFPRLKKEDWFIFEIGRNCGTVFSADCVKKIELQGHHAIIHLKG